VLQIPHIIKPCQLFLHFHKLVDHHRSSSNCEYYIQPHYSHLPQRRPRANLKEGARTVATPGFTPTSTTHADTNVEGTSAVEIQPNQAESETSIGSRSSSLFQQSRHIQPAGDSTSELRREETRKSWGNTDTPDTTSDLNKRMCTTQ